MKPWSHLSNAHYIDWVLESVRTDFEKWAAAWNAACNAAQATTRAAARSAALDAAWDAAWNAARYAAWNAARGATWYATWDATCDAILALIAYNDCDQYLQMSYKQLLAWAHLSEKPQALLLLPMKWVQEHECLVTSI